MKIKIPVYRLDKQNLSYQKIILNGKTVLKFFFTQLIISIILMFLLSIISNTPKERRLKEELNSLKYEFHNMENKVNDIEQLLILLEQKDSVIYQSLFSISHQTDQLELDFHVDTVNLIGNKLTHIKKRLEMANNYFRLLMIEVGDNNERLNHTPAIQPISNTDLRRTSSGFGMRIHPIYRIKKMHNGMDFVAPVGTPIYATADGTISIASNSYYGYGKYVKIIHNNDYQTTYGHMHTINVKKGQLVKRGDIIGTVGNTGLSTGNHLHYEVIYKNRFVDPINYYFHDLTPSQYQEMIHISNSVEKSLD